MSWINLEHHFQARKDLLNKPCQDRFELADAGFSFLLPKLEISKFQPSRQPTVEIPSEECEMIKQKMKRPCLCASEVMINY